MAIALQGTPTLVESATSATVAVTVPTSTTVGEVLICAVTGSRVASGDTLTMPAGWTQAALKTDSAGATGLVTGLYYRVVTGSEAGSYTWTNTSGTAGRISGAMQRVSGVDTTTVLDVTPTTAGSATQQATIDCPSITTVTANTLMVSVASLMTGVTSDITPPAGMTLINSAGNANGRRQGWATEAIAATGATGARLWTKNVAGTGSQWAGITAALRPSSGSTSGTVTAVTATGTGAAGVPTPSGGATPLALVGTPTLVENAASATVAVTVPAGTVVGELLLCAVTGSRTTTANTLTPPSGWNTAVTVKDTDPSGVVTGLYWRAATGMETASYTWTCTAVTAGRITGAMQRVSGADTISPMDVTPATAFGDVLQATIPTPSVTTVTDGALLVSVASILSATSTDLTPPAGMTLVNTTTGTGRRQAWGTELIPTAGATGTRVWDKTDPLVATQWAGLTAAVRPGAADTPTPGAVNAVRATGTGTAKAPTVSPAPSSGDPTPPVPVGALLFVDHFDGAAGTLPDSSKWGFESHATGFAGRNGELQYYTNADLDNAFIDGASNLNIVCRSESIGGKAYSSASILTDGKFAWTGGYIEFRAKLPTGSGTWPGLWAVGNGTWPDCGEIDVMEAVNSDALTTSNVHGGPVHWSDYGDTAIVRSPAAFHTFGANVLPDRIVFYLDGVAYHTVLASVAAAGQTWPFNTNPQDIRINLAMGGSFPGTPNGSATLPLTLQVDYVKVWAPSDFPASGGNEALNSRVVSPTFDDGTVKVTTNTANTSAVRLKIGTDTGVTTGVTYSAGVTPNAQGDATHTISGLTRGTTYYYRVVMDSTEDTASVVGKIKVAPTAGTQASFAFDFGACCNATDSASFTTMRTRDDALFLHLGDLFYDDGAASTAASFRTHFDTQMRATNQGALYATTGCVFTPSDHDCAMVNNGDGASFPTAVANYNVAHREKLPSALVPATSGVYQTFAYGRVRFIVTDTRTLRTAPSATDNSSKTMFGTTQKAWVKSTITAATEKVIVITSDVPWASATSAGDDNWGGYTTERAEMAAFFNASGKEVVVVSGDMHAVAASDGASNGGGIPNYAAAPFNNNSSIKGGPWTSGPYPASGTSVVTQYGRVVVTDSGSTIALAFTGYSSDNTARVSRTDTFTVTTDATVAGVRAQGTAVAGVPTVSGATVSNTVTALRATGSGAAQAPSITGSTIITGGGPASGTGLALAPVVTATGSATVAAVRALGTGTANAPTVTFGSTVTTVWAQGTGAAGVPTVTGSATGQLAAVRAQGNGIANPPTVTGTSTGQVIAVAGTGTGIVPVPTVAGTGTGTVTGARAQGTGAAGTPTATGTSTGTVTGIRATGTGTANAPALTGTSTGQVVAVRAQGSGAANAPTVAFGSTLPSVRAQGTGLARPPTVQGGTVSTLPAVVTHGAVKAWLGSGVNVSPDADGYADLIPDVGTVTFTPVASVLTFPTATPAPLILTPRVVVCTLDFDGYLIGTKTGAAEKLVRLIAGDWTVSYQLTGVTLAEHKITVTGGVTIDLAEVMPT